METPEIEGWPKIDLAWRQKMAAFWSVYWPSGMVSLAIILGITLPFSSVGLLRAEAAPALNWAGSLIALFGQGFFVRRLIRKRYRTFRIEVLRAAVLSSPALSTGESAQVALKIIWPQVATLALQFLAMLSLTGSARAIGSFLFLARFFVVGPYAIAFALGSDYPGFRLQSFGQRYI
jgi:hypothetical protein